ncbi:hypothetical protein CIT292_08576 [Citrobacter youngae ATCC 29220]|uniref:Uncharacterized protein n=1 Tax=Citrobacter youngae ATCC 29220 TaxID=500640 RepID=D4BDK9_9ENTR|nr:hypothetical protein CIT292_08576 [Citrobacter youngae ATCC 29220]
MRESVIQAVNRNSISFTPPGFAVTSRNLWSALSPFSFFTKWTFTLINYRE